MYKRKPVYDPRNGTGVEAKRILRGSNVIDEGV